MSSGIRAFVAVYPSKEAHEKIVAFRDSLRSSFCFDRGSIRWANEQQLHLTLRFIESVEPGALGEHVGGLRDIVARFEAQTLRCSYVGPLWRNCRIIGLKVESDSSELAALNEQIESLCESMGIAREQKSFNPHITLARLDSPALHPSLRQKLIARWTCSELVLVKSELQQRGATHTPIATFELCAGKD